MTDPTGSGSITGAMAASLDQARIDSAAAMLARHLAEYVDRHRRPESAFPVEDQVFRPDGEGYRLDAFIEYAGVSCRYASYKRETALILPRWVHRYADIWRLRQTSETQLILVPPWDRGHEAAWRTIAIGQDGEVDLLQPGRWHYVDSYWCQLPPVADEPTDGGVTDQ